MTVTNYQTGEVCVVEFKAEGWGGKNKQCVEGYTYESLEDFKGKNKHPKHHIFGTWTGSVSYRPMQADGKEVDESVESTKLWEGNPFPLNSEM